MTIADEAAAMQLEVARLVVRVADLRERLADKQAEHALKCSQELASACTYLGMIVNLSDARSLDNSDPID